MALDNTWYTEQWADQGSAISLKVTRKLHEERSAFQLVEIWETETFGRLMTLDGLVMVTGRDNFIYHEMLSHPALLTHPAPKRVLIIGGGDCGTLREVLRHPGVEHALQIEIDERVTRVAEQFFPELCESNGDPRAELRFEDGVEWVRNVPEGSYDVILVDSTDPVGPAEGLFTADFYRACHRALRPGGVVAGQSESPLFHLPIIQGLHRAMKDAGFPSVETLTFPQCTYPSGWWSVTLAHREARPASIRACAFPTRYYNAEIHQAARALPAYVREALASL
jgi:spermidine synthase